MDFIGEIDRIRDDFKKLAVRDEAGLEQLRNEVITVIDLMLPEKDAKRYVSQVKDIWFHPMAFVTGVPNPGISEWREGQDKMVALIESVKHHAKLLEQQPPATAKKATATNKVFIVHGHDAPMLHEVEAFVRRIGIEPTILKEEASRGKTVIEKVEYYADVPFAIVLFSADDIGRARGAKPEEEKLRARQNAVLELGFFMGRLGRENVCVIIDAALDSETEYPTDMAGVVTVPYQKDGDWKTRIVRELRASKIPFDEARL